MARPRFMDIDTGSEYLKCYAAECFHCHSISMEKILIDEDRIKVDLQYAYNDDFNAGYKKAKEEFRKKLGL